MKPAIATAEVVMKACLIFSVVVGTLVILLAFVGKQNVFEVGGSVLPTVGVQWLFYMWVRARRRSNHEAELKGEPMIEESTNTVSDEKS